LANYFANIPELPWPAFFDISKHTLIALWAKIAERCTVLNEKSFALTLLGWWFHFVEPNGVTGLWVNPNERVVPPVRELDLH
jgi:hypothetical protein